MHELSRQAFHAPLQFAPAQFDILERGLERMRGMLHQFAADIFPSEAPLEAAAMHELLAFTRAASAIHLADTPDSAGAVAPAGAVDRAPVPVASLPAPAPAAASTSARTVAVSEPALDEHVLAHHLPVLPVASAVEVVPPAPIRDELDADLLEVFLTEANDLLPAVGANLRALAGDHGNQNVARELMRQLHTIKGSARMAGAMRLGECVHHMETRIEESMTAPLVPPAVIDDLQSRYDQAMTLFDELVHPQPPTPEAPAEEDAEPTVVTTSSAPSPDIVVPGPIVVPMPAPSFPPTFAPTSTAPSFPTTMPPTMPGGVAPAAPVFTAPTAGPRVAPVAVDAPATSISTTVPGAPGAAQTATYVRVRADVLDKLVDQAGEVSIARSKVENEISTLRTALTDLTENISRLRTQLREVEIQAESQIQTHSDKLDKASAQFDPLEFDRYTRLQELTRLLAESVEDVAMVQSNMLKGLQMADGDLTAQMRLTRELQQQLMRVRLVPFANIGERLYRVARQSAKELGKRVNLEIKGGTVEIDRGVLERMSGPFEHLVRNCIVHGLEMPAERGAAGKAETGEIGIEVRQEGNEIIAVVSDDGAGLNLPRIRTRAIERRLIGADQHLSDKELIELIFAPGFSTAESVTELAGRGVGMDVVRAELGGFGGRIAVSSEAGRGTRFTLYMPLTLAVTQVVLAKVGGRRYAIPAGMVEQVRRLRPTFLSEALAQGSIDLPPVGDVVLRPLAQLLGEPVNMHLSKQMPVVLLRSGDDRLAVAMDDVSSNQEVVVKNVGAQVARLTGILGATILGNGDIVLILNPVHLISRAPEPASLMAMHGAHLRDEPMTPQVVTESPGVVMVVDDSLTVRRVSQRLLERNGYEVLLAKDGVDALRQLQDVQPDVMLVDIEMPRMDGFDLTRNVRSNPATRGIPILMITSRTAEKHRNHALELGVNEYLGKPYQEDQLLSLIRRYLAERASA